MSYQLRHQAQNHRVRLGVTQAFIRLGVTQAQKKCLQHLTPHKVKLNNSPRSLKDSRRG